MPTMWQGSSRKESPSIPLNNQLSRTAQQKELAEKLILKRSGKSA